MNEKYRNYDEELENKIIIVARIDGWEYVKETNTMTKLVTTGRIYSSPKDLHYDTSFNWIIPVVCRINLNDRWWKIFITDCSVIMTKEAGMDKAIYTINYQRPAALARALFEQVYKYSQFRLNSKDYDQILLKRKNYAIERHEKYILDCAFEDAV